MWSGIWSVTATRIGFWTWIWPTRHCWLGRKCLVDFNAGKFQLVLFDRSKTLVLLMWKWMGLFLRKNQLLRCWSFFLMSLFYISINLPYSHIWNNVVMSELVFVVATWNCWISYRNRYAGQLVLWLLPLMNLWVIVEM